ncbi:MAG: molybdopterin-dependent oxidoreductase [Anaerolineae bacterium]|nr:molybdopterin-dependent oxidoreductase [Phycisphaerae bacterium]
MANAFGKDKSFLVRSDRPFNGGPPPGRVLESFITPVPDFFVRAHAVDVPVVDVGSYALEVGGLVRSPLTCSLSDLRSKFATHQLTATMQCAGNRRDQLIAIEAIPGEVPWGCEAISNGQWEGVRLSDVLEAAGVDSASGAAHVEFIGLDQVDRHGQVFSYGGSIPLDKARQPEVLLAWSMNGKPLEPIHGFPLRMIIPGYICARSVKWLKQINVLGHPSQNYFQSHAYKLFGSHVRAATVDWNAGVMIGTTQVTSAITSPGQGASITAGNVRIAGWAIAGERAVERVEVSADGGKNWSVAEFADQQDKPDRWTWRFWEARVSLSPGHYQIVARATDSAGTTQPPDAKALWNFKGYMNNAWHRVDVDVR